MKILQVVYHSVCEHGTHQDVPTDVKGGRDVLVTHQRVVARDVRTRRGVCDAVHSQKTKDHVEEDKKYDTEIRSNVKLIHFRLDVNSALRSIREEGGQFLRNTSYYLRKLDTQI